MTNLQHQLSQRQQLVELATNALRSLHDDAMKIIQNLGGGGGNTHGGVVGGRRVGDEAVGADAHTLSPDSQLKYANLRRYFVHLNESIGKGIQFAGSSPTAKRCGRTCAPLSRIFCSASGKAARCKVSDRRKRTS